jgi:hypothetical protein
VIGRGVPSNAAVALTAADTQILLILCTNFDGTVVTVQLERHRLVGYRVLATQLFLQRGGASAIAVIRRAMMSNSCSMLMPFSSRVNMSSMLKPATPPNRTNFLHALMKALSIVNPHNWADRKETGFGCL